MRNRDVIARQLSLYFIISLQKKGEMTPYELAKSALDGGVTMIQLREKHAPVKEILAEGKKIRTLCQERGVPFIVNDRVDLAILLEADGVHLGQEDIPYAEARKLLGEERMIGISAGNWEEANDAIAAGADYLGVGSIYRTRSKSDAGEPIGTRLIRGIKQTTDIPIVGIGGIEQRNAAEVIQAGADGIAVISAISDHEDPRKAASMLYEIVMKWKSE